MTLQEVRQRKKESKKSLRYFWIAVCLGNIILLTMLAIISYNL
jgi:hypothetical protein